MAAVTAIVTGHRPPTTPWYRRLTRRPDTARPVRRSGSSQAAGVAKESRHVSPTTSARPMGRAVRHPSAPYHKRTTPGSVPTSPESRAGPWEGRTLLTVISCPDCGVPAEVTERFSLPEQGRPRSACRAELHELVTACGGGGPAAGAGARTTGRAGDPHEDPHRPDLHPLHGEPGRVLGQPPQQPGRAPAVVPVLLPGTGPGLLRRRPVRSLVVTTGNTPVYPCVLRRRVPGWFCRWRLVRLVHATTQSPQSPKVVYRAAGLAYVSPGGSGAGCLRCWRVMCGRARWN